MEIGDILSVKITLKNTNQFNIDCSSGVHQCDLTSMVLSVVEKINKQNNVQKTLWLYSFEKKEKVCVSLYAKNFEELIQNGKTIQENEDFLINIEKLS